MSHANATLLDTRDAARVLGLTVRGINKLVRGGLIPHIILPTGEVRFVEDDLWAWIKDCRQKPEGVPQ